MKKPHKKTADRPQALRIRDLATVRGGDNGLLHMDAIVGGGKVIADENGVIHMQ